MRNRRTFDDWCRLVLHMPPTRSRITETPLLWLSAFFAIGILLGRIGSIPLGLSIPVCAAFAGAAIVFSSRQLSTLLISLAFICCGVGVQTAADNSTAADRISRFYDEQPAAFDGTVELDGTIASSEVSPDGKYYVLNVERLNTGSGDRSASGRVRVFAPALGPDAAVPTPVASVRSRVKISCEIKRADEYRNPGGVLRGRILEWQGLDASCSLRDPLAMTALEAGSAGFDPSARIAAARDGLIAEMRRLFAPQVAGVMIASLLGNKHFLDKPTADLFREGGTFHILVISGLHITVIGSIVAFIVGFFTRRRIVQFAVATTFLWVYTVAVGADVPVVRASLMFTILCFGYAIHRPGSLANALGACGMVLLAIRPNDLFTPSFQLTFVSVAAIVLAGVPLVSILRQIGSWTPSRTHPFPANVPRWLSRACEFLYWNVAGWEIESSRSTWTARLYKPAVAKAWRYLQRPAAYLVEGLLMSAIVQAAMLPLSIHYFHRLVSGAVVLNLWTGAAIAVESFAAVTAVAAAAFSDALAAPFVRVAEFAHSVMTLPYQLMGPAAIGIRIPVYSDAGPVLYAGYLTFALAACLSIFVWDPFKVPAKQRVLSLSAAGSAIVVCAIVGSILIFHPFSRPQADGQLHVEFLDVGQGDSALVTFPDRSTMLVDGGGRRRFEDSSDGFEPDVPSIGEIVVSEFLWERGYSAIDRVVATHADADHIQGLSDVVRNFSVGEAWLGRINGSDADEAEFLRALNERGTPIRKVVRGERIEIGGAVVEILNPGEDEVMTTSENDRSVVLRIVFGGRSFLLTGDIERSAEAIVSAGPVRADVVKVPHHGSKTSSTDAFVNAVRPAVAIIPVGRRSPFHHPNAEVVERWLGTGASVLTTGRSGTISFTTNGEDLDVRTFIPLDHE